MRASSHRPPQFVRLSTVYFFYFAGLGALIPYISLYFQHLGFSPIQIGVLMGVLIGTKVIAPNLWGWLADKTHKLAIWIQISSFLAFITLAGLGILNTFSTLLWIVLLFSFFWHATLPLFEAYTFKTLGALKAAYGRVRLWGSIGFIVAVLLFGWVIEHWGVTVFPGLLVSILALTFVSTLWVYEPANALHQTEPTQQSIPIWQVVRQPWILYLLGASFLIQFSHGAYYSFYSIYLTEAGYSKPLIAWLWALGVLAEIGIFFYMPRLLHRWSAWTLLKFALLLTAIRWWVIAEGVDHLSLLLFAQTLHAASYGLFHAGAIFLIDQHFSRHHQARGQAIYASISHGLGGGLGMLMAGVWWTHFGGEMTYLINAAIAALAWLLIWKVR
ncbi:MFS transporter [Galenea microaerophila]